MSLFSLGFIKEATEHGLSSKEATHMLKRALEHDEAASLFKSLDTPAEEDENSDSLDDLVELMKQDFIDKHMSAAKHQVNI